MKKILVSCIVFVGLFVFSPAFAADSVNIDLKIYAGDDVLFDDEIEITSCSESPEPDAPISLNGKCAVEQSGLSHTFTWSDFDGDGKSTDGFLDELEGNASDFVNNFYWGWYSNLEYGMTSLSSHRLDDGDELLLTYNSYPLRLEASATSGVIGSSITFTVEENGFDSSFNSVWTPSEGATVTLGSQTCTTTSDGACSITLNTSGSHSATASKTLHVPSDSIDIEISTTPSSGGGSASSSKPKVGNVLGAETKASFDLKKAFDFLITQQKADGSFESGLYTDWVGVALGSTPNYKTETIKLIKYFGENPSGTTLTDYERHAMALMALGLNPYNIYPSSGAVNGENYIGKIVSSFDGKQFGDLHQDNDDIFALIVLQNVGFGAGEKMIADDIAFVLGAQRENGSWDESIDMTGAAIRALVSFKENEQVGLALAKAKEFLKQNQKENGGWGNNASSTAWAIEGILALGEKVEDWKKGENTPFDYLATLQDIDGGIKNTDIKNKIWETAYVATAYSGKTWSEIMQKFEKPKEGAVLGASTEIKPVETKPAPKKATVKPRTEIQTEKTAPVATQLEENNTPQPEPPSENWFMRLIHFIF
jgi:hypothetical protein